MMGPPPPASAGRCQAATRAGSRATSVAAPAPPPPPPTAPPPPPPPPPALPNGPSRAEFLADLGLLAPWDVVPGTERENWGCHKPNPHGQPERQAKKEQAEEFRRYRDEMLNAGRKCPYGFALRMGKDGVLLDDIEHGDRGDCLWPLLTNEATLRSIGRPKDRDKGRKYKSWKELGRKDTRIGRKRERKDTRRGRKDPRRKRKDTRTGRARPDLRLKEQKMAAVRSGALPSCIA